jgi:SAM-dependent methyltransferase
MTYPLPDSELFSRVSREIHPRCEMFAFAARTAGEEAARNYYFHSAHFLVERLLGRLARDKRRPQDLAILDFASGYGRFARFFAALFRRVTVADIDPEMVEFNRRAFGVDGFLSPSDPSSLRPTPDYDVVFAFSLFTHLAEEPWRAWLDALWEFVRPQGLLVFSARTPRLGERLAESVGGSVGGDRLAVLDRPNAPLAKRELHVYGVRISLRGADRVGPLEGTIRVRLHLRSAEPLALGAARLDESYPRYGLAIDEPRVSLARSGQDYDLDIELSFTADRSIVDLPIGGIAVALELPRPAFVELLECAVRPTLEVRALRVDHGGGFVFRATNETAGRLDPQRYGSTTVSPEFVRAAASRLPGAGELEHFAGGEFDLHQDVFVVPKL